MQWMHCTRVLLRVILPGALHPRRRSGRTVIVRSRRLVLIARAGAGLDLLIGPTHAAERIGLTYQARELGQRVALTLGRRALTASITVIVRGKRSVLISISHRDDASPSGKPPNPSLSTNRPPPDAPTDPPRE